MKLKMKLDLGEKNMIALGIESTAHTFGIGIVDEKCNVLANEKASLRPKEGGLIPRELGEHHFANAENVLKQALEKADLKLNDVDAIAFSQGPGIGNALRVGALMARALHVKTEKPLVGVNHCVAHVEIGKIKCKCRDPVTVYVSGANTQVLAFQQGRYAIFGETLDIGFGNAMDSFGRALGLPFPAGPVLDQWYFEVAKKEGLGIAGSDVEGGKYIELPYTVKGSDWAFSGLQTAAERLVGTVQEKNLAYSFMHTGLAMITEVTERVLAHTGKNEVLLAGGVAAGNALRKIMQDMCESRDAKLFVPEPNLCVDNGAMIAWTGLLMYKNRKCTKLSESKIKPKQRADEIIANWVK